jgi:BspA type Leucine rich repeat region (6 copies)/Listeria-Bacteroides repeat domain (List_Bact_rpt)
MKSFRLCVALLVCIGLSVFFSGCPAPASGGNPPTTYNVTYDANATGITGSVPVDTNSYPAGGTVTVLGNTGALTNTGYALAGWTTNPNAVGASVSYAAGTTYAMGSGNLTLYAVWIPNTLYFTSSGNTIVLTGQTLAGPTVLIIPPGVTSLGNAFIGCSALTGVTIPSSVATVNGALQNCTNLTSVTISAGVTAIGTDAFFGCTSLTSVVIPSTVTSIGAEAFDGCTALVTLDIPSNVTSIQDHTFDGCSHLANVTIPANVLTIGRFAFNSCTSLASVTIPTGVTSIGDSAFHASGLTTIATPNTVTTIGQNVFDSCASLTSASIASGTIGWYAFTQCPALTSVTLGNGVTSIGNFAFTVSGLTSVIIPDSVTYVGDQAFSADYNLANATIGTGVTYMNFTFVNCYALTTVVINASNPPTNSGPASGGNYFGNDTALTAVKVPANSVTAYKQSGYWSSWASLIVSQ